ncbi:hypothetical protein NP233_g9275 [Leucocoprinus birnbaumii]|uniref:Uncharacterized protein n=1 Tax=Leucocoprinus birnbaumii TaxID=56174 RepID=A0AAD5VP94_9AGAR|nr:hypothetical protein NP233_g9275 [Leucocoprinus birnbaumii]
MDTSIAPSTLPPDAAMDVDTAHQELLPGGDGGDMGLRNHIPSSQSHAARHPLQEIIPVSHFSARPPRQVLKERSIQSRQRALRLQADLDELNKAREAQILELAKKHNRKALHIRCMANNIKNVKRIREPTLKNALLYKKAREVNEGLPTGSKSSLSELRAAIAADPTLQISSMTEARKTQLINEVKAHRELKWSGARVNNCAATQDYNHTMKRVQGEYDGLYSRTGILGFGMFSRTHINDGAVPAWVESSKALDFLKDEYNQGPLEFGRGFELWACSKGANGGNRLSDLQRGCAKMISESLSRVLGRPNARMSYGDYDTAIRQRHHIQLRGWPKGVPFKPPSQIARFNDVRALHNALRLNECVWVKMTRSEIDELMEKAEQQLPKVRRKRKDAGGIHQRRARVSNNENIDPNIPTAVKKSTKQSRAKKQMPPAPRSRSVVDSDDDHEATGHVTLQFNQLNL